MDIDLRGRVNNTKLTPPNCLLPVFEAIINSIHAIEEKGKIRGSIEITIERDRSQGLLEADDLPLAAGPIWGFAIQDNGIGFTEENFRSFETSDTIKKVAKGGKGVGRLVWLKAFEKAEIESHYAEGDKLWRRRFDFAYTQHGIEGHSLEVVAESQRRTVVRLIGFKPEYERPCPKTASTIARRIVEHCLEYFALDACPRITLIDPDAEEKIELKQFYAEVMRVQSESRQFTIKGNDFRVNHVLINSGHDGQHRIFFCAHHRAVRSEPLSNKVPDLISPLRDREDGRSIVYSGYLSGDYLDKAVNAERTSFHVLDHLELNMPEELSWDELVRGMVAKAGEFLSPYTEPIKKTKHDRIREYVHTQAPQYRPVVKHRSDWLDEISANLPDDKLDVELYKIDQRYSAELRDEALHLQSVNGTAKTAQDHKSVFERFIEEWNEHGMAKLARYVAHRKATLAFLADRLKLREDGRYPLEESVHQIIFPLRQTSDDIRSDRMNLWIIDEKLAYHHYLASDRLFKQMEPIDVDSKNRPDLLIFNHSFAFADSEPPFGSIVLVEFKRPARDDYSDEENPIAQVYGYVREIKQGTAKDRQGRPIRVPPHTPFYAYIVCDLTPKLIRQAENAQLTPTPDSQGFFGYNSNLGIYVEVLSFDKLVGDARKRNAVLFEKLGLKS
jgi:hypothetical protein